MAKKKHRNKKREKKIAKKKSLRKDIPEDITRNILHRLPLKSLVRSRCVSKSWLSIISYPFFAKSHFKRESEQKTVARRLLLIYDGRPCWFQSFYEIPSFGDSSSFKNLTRPFKKHGHSKVDVLGSTNGLLFVALYDIDYSRNRTYKCFYIWNPSTGVIHKLPDPSLMLGFREKPCELSYSGSGYVSTTEDYKALVNIGGNYQMFSMRAKLWKKIEPPKLSIWERRIHFNQSAPIGRMNGIVLNEALHWLLLSCRIETRSYENAILAFDLEKEEFREVPLPIPDENNQRGFLDMGVVCGGCLCVVALGNFRQSTGADHVVRSMKEYGVRESWTKLFKIVNSLSEMYVGVDLSKL